MPMSSQGPWRNGIRWAQRAMLDAVLRRSRTLPRPVSGLFSLVVVALAMRPDLGWGASSAMAPEEIYRTLLPSVLTVEVETRKGERVVGTGFLAIEPGVAVTAWHLIEDARRVQARFADGTTVAVTGWIDRDVEKDVALVRVAVEGRPLCRLEVGPPAVGSRVYAIGAPRGYAFSLSDGLVSQTPLVDGYQQYQVSCPISPGNSGGPVLNPEGAVMGVVSWSQQDAQNLNFATPVSHLRSLDCTRSPTSWSDRGKSVPRRQGTARHRESRDAPRPGLVARGLPELQALLKASQGRPLTVTVDSGTRTQTFCIVVPDGGFSLTNEDGALAGSASE